MYVTNSVQFYLLIVYNYVLFSVCFCVCVCVCVCVERVFMRVCERARQRQIKRGKVFVKNLASSTKSLKSPYQRIWENVLGSKEKDPSRVKTH